MLSLLFDMTFLQSSFYFQQFASQRCPVANDCTVNLTHFWDNEDYEMFICTAGNHLSVYMSSHSFFSVKPHSILGLCLILVCPLFNTKPLTLVLNPTP